MPERKATSSRAHHLRMVQHRCLRWSRLDILEAPHVL